VLTIVDRSSVEERVMIEERGRAISDEEIVGVSGNCAGEDRFSSAVVSSTSPGAESGR
jgi:hypothetical protein